MNVSSPATAAPKTNAGLEPILKLAPVVPVMIIEDLKTAVPLARALVAGGLKALEITLRTPVALEAARLIAAEVEGAEVGIGTVLTAAQLEQCDAIGAKFAVSPGATARLLDAADSAATPLLPGSGTPSESMTLLERGYVFQKFFPAEPSGGAAYLGSLSSPLPAVRFCPTGGVTPEKAKAYLKLKNIICVGGSWMAPKELVAAGDWAKITALSAEAAALGR